MFECVRDGQVRAHGVMGVCGVHVGALGAGAGHGAGGQDRALARQSLIDGDTSHAWD